MPVHTTATKPKEATPKNRGADPHRDAVAPFARREAPPATGGKALDRKVRSAEESRTGADLSPVRIHQGSEAARRTEEAGARALTIGENIFPSPRTPDLQTTREGNVVLRHELEHVLESRRNPSLREVTLRLPEAQLITELDQRLTAHDPAGYLQLLRTEAGAHAASVAVRTAIGTHLTAGRITSAQAWRAVSLQVLGAEETWPRVVRNFVDGVDSAVFTPPAGLAPGTSAELMQTASRTATLAIANTTDFDRYRAEFNSRWILASYQAFSAEFDPTLDSRGPRSQRARHIFQDLYNSNVQVQMSYDVNGITRHDIDEYTGPSGANLEASPRIETLRRVFIRAPLASATTTDPDYVTFKAAVNTTAQTLDPIDRQNIEASSEWRLLIDGIVAPSALRDDLMETIRSARAPAPAVGGAGPAVGAGPVALPPVAPPLTLTADQQTFVGNLALTGPASPRVSQQRTETLAFNPSSSRDPAALNVRSRVEVTPPGNVESGQVTTNAWPPAALAGATHSATVENSGGTAGFVDFTGSLTVVPAVGTITQTPRTAVVRVTDDRRTFFIANIRHGLIFSDQNTRFLWSSGNTVSYYGGQVTLRSSPRFAAGANRGLPAFVQASFSRNGTALLPALTRVEFGLAAQSVALGGITVLESTPPSATADHFVLTVEFFPSADPAAVAFHTITQPFDVQPGSAFTNAMVLAQLVADWTDLNATGAGSFLATMTASGGQAARTSEAIRAGNVTVEPMLIRADSAAHILAAQGPAAALTNVAYALGHAAISDADTNIAAPGADAKRLHARPTTLFLNLTPSLASPATKRSPASIIGNMVHESVHALDFPRVPTAGVTIERYKTEFRAYWMDGARDNRPVSEGGGLRSTAFDPAMGGRGPKSEKARAIFEHLYGSDTYRYVKPAYDANTSGFREQADAYVVPDGINLISSMRLDNLRKAIEGYTHAGFPAHAAAIQTLFNATNGLDRQEIFGNVMWRTLIESMYAPIEQNTIKPMLGIPR
jgi:hypothetical protein